MKPISDFTSTTSPLILASPISAKRVFVIPRSPTFILSSSSPFTLESMFFLSARRSSYLPYSAHRKSDTQMSTDTAIVIQPATLPTTKKA